MTHADEQQSPEAVIPPHQAESVLGVSGVLKIRPYRRLWGSVAASSLGEWLGLLALTSAALWTVDGGYRDHAVAIAAVLVLRLLPAALISPLAGALADHLNRRWTMTAAETVRAALIVSVPFVDKLWWIWVVAAVGGIAGAFYNPARDATLPNLVPRQRLGTAAQFNLVTGYAAAPVAAVLFVLAALVTRVLAPQADLFADHPSNLALYAAALIHLAAAVSAFLIRMPSRGRALTTRRPLASGFFANGRRVLKHGRTARGLILGMIALFLGGGALISLAPLLAVDLQAGNAAYGMVFLSLLTGVAAGMLWGPRVVPAFSRRRLYGLSVVFAGLVLTVLAVTANIVVVVVLSAVVGGCAGVAWVTGYTMFGLDLGEELRGKAFAFAQTLVRFFLLLALAAAPVAAGFLGVHRWTAGDFTFDYNGAAITLAVTGLLVTLLGWLALRSVDDRRGTGVIRDLVAASRNEDHVTGRPAGAKGFFIALEGGEGAGKSTQVDALASWIRAKGHEVVITREPGATEIGKRLRAMLLDIENSGGTGISPRAEALLFAADRAEHVATVIRPALQRGAIVITDRYMDSSVAYQGAGRNLGPREIARTNRWGTDGLRPDLTVLLDLDPEVGHSRFTEAPDRIESEPVDFHRRIRNAFLDLAALDPDHYLVVDAAQAPDNVTTSIRHRLDRELPLSAQETRQAAELARRMREEEELRKAEQVRRDAEKAALIARLKAESEDRQRQAEEARMAQEAAQLEEDERFRLENELRAKAAEQKRRADEATRAAEAARVKAEEDRTRLEADMKARAAEQKRLAEEATERAEDAARRAAEETVRRDEQRKRMQEATALQAERARVAAEEERAAAVERRREAEAERDRLEKEGTAEKARLRKEQEKAETDARRRAEERRRTEEALTLAAADRRRAEEDTKRAGEAAAATRAIAAREAAALAEETGGVGNGVRPDQDTTPVRGVSAVNAPARAMPPMEDATIEVPVEVRDALRRADAQRRGRGTGGGVVEPDTTEIPKIRLKPAGTENDTREIPQVTRAELEAMAATKAVPVVDEPADAPEEPADEPAGEPKKKGRWRKS